jgi:hypothetical protein
MHDGWGWALGSVLSNASRRLSTIPQLHKKLSLKGQCHELFASDFFMNHLPPNPRVLTIPIALF